ncbi:MAG: hypothetical protein ACFFCO_03395 [Promethearchaeota archaeon]
MYIVATKEDFQELVQSGEKARGSIAIIEPDAIVGTNPLGEPVAASHNVAVILREIAQQNSILFSLWNTGFQSLDMVTPFAQFLRSCNGIIVEGGRPSIYDSQSFNHNPSLPREEFLSLVESLLLNRTAGSAPALYICLGHQAVGEALIRLIRRAITNLQCQDDLPKPARKAFRDISTYIHQFGEQLVIRRKRHIIANGYRDTRFAVAPNEQREVGIRRLHPYQPLEHLPEPLLKAHEKTAATESGIIEDLIRIDDWDLAMLHGDEVNQEAILFANWALNHLNNELQDHRDDIASSPHTWLLNLPFGVEVLCSTFFPDSTRPLTEVAAMAIYYQDHNTGQRRRDFSLQFHPELLDDLRTFRVPPTPPPPLHDSDGTRLLVTLLRREGDHQ